MSEEEITRLLFEHEPFEGYKDAMRAIEIHDAAERIYQAALAAMCPVRTYTTDSTCPVRPPLL